MPAKTEKQRKFMGAELARKRAGKKTQTGMSEKELEKFATKKKQSYASELRRSIQRAIFAQLPPGDRYVARVA
jgi:hypothetical protein